MFARVAHDADLTDADQNTDALIDGRVWTFATLTYSFPLDASAYGYAGAPLNGFTALTDAGRAMMEAAIGMVAGFTALGFSELGDDPGEDAGAAILQIGETASTTSAFAYFPSTAEQGGDIWFRNTAPAWDPAGFDAPALGGWSAFTMMHELGHALGLKHGHETHGPGAMTADRDSMEFSIMTYRSFAGAGTTGYTNEAMGYAQSFMMHDIAALQRLYGANWTENAGDTVYAFSESTGEMVVDGEGQGAPGANRIFRTIWDGGGVDTYDLSSYAAGLVLDLAPGGWSDFSAGSDAQNARLGAGIFARGHVFNALLFGDDPRSLIENALGGAGDDRIAGNVAGNTLAGNDGVDLLLGLDGADLLLGGAGTDTLADGAGADTLFGGAGADTFVLAADGAADMIGDWAKGDLIDLSAWSAASREDIRLRGLRDTGEVVVRDRLSGETATLCAEDGWLLVREVSGATFLFG